MVSSLLSDSDPRLRNKNLSLRSGVANLSSSKIRSTRCIVMPHLLAIPSGIMPHGGQSPPLLAAFGRNHSPASLCQYPLPVLTHYAPQKMYATGKTVEFLCCIRICPLAQAQEAARGRCRPIDTVPHGTYRKAASTGKPGIAPPAGGAEWTAVRPARWPRLPRLLCGKGLAGWSIASKETRTTDS